LTLTSTLNHSAGPLASTPYSHSHSQSSHSEQHTLLATAIYTNNRVYTHPLSFTHLDLPHHPVHVQRTRVVLAVHTVVLQVPLPHSDVHNMTSRHTHLPPHPLTHSLTHSLTFSGSCTANITSSMGISPPSSYRYPACRTAPEPYAKAKSTAGKCRNTSSYLHST
jgi:hypothetical protein